MLKLPNQPKVCPDAMNLSKILCSMLQSGAQKNRSTETELICLEHTLDIIQNRMNLDGSGSNVT